MPFDSQPVRSDEAYSQRDCQLELPDDLALMGEQLRDDAQRLASSYPARLGPVVDLAAAVVAASQASRRPARRRDLIISSAVGGLVALGLLAMFTLGQGSFLGRAERKITVPGTATIDHQPAADSDAGAGHALAAAPRLVPPPADSIAALPGELLTPASFSGAMPSVTPAVLSSGITGPEMEAWMDLRQDELQTNRDSLEF